MGPATEATIRCWSSVDLSVFISWDKAWYDFVENMLFVPMRSTCMQKIRHRLVNHLHWGNVAYAADGVAMSMLAEQIVFKCQQLA